MAGKKRKAAEQKRWLLHVLQECEDLGNDAATEKLCRTLYRNFTIMDTPVVLAEEKIVLLEEALSALKDRRYHAAQICLGRVDELNQSVIKEAGSRKKMGLLEKVKSKLPWDKDRGQEVLFQREEAAAEQKIFEIQKRIGDLYDNLSAVTKQVEEKAAKCAAISPDSNEYKQIRQQAVALLPQIRALEQQLKLYAKALENSSRYHAMLQTGRTTFELKSFVPDISRSEAMMEWIAEETGELSENTAEMEKGIERYENRIQASSEVKGYSHTQEFDELVQLRKKEIKTERAETAQEEVPILGDTDKQGNDRETRNGKGELA
ncbi:hypothetical protein D7Y05_01460 [bacterium 1XD42-54]|nr:hypothetical protein D7Y05_01460 [bacterium 1XD42-54]